MRRTAFTALAFLIGIFFLCPTGFAQQFGGMPMYQPGPAKYKLGDKAPKLVITDWVKGKPFDMEKEGKGKIIILEFWATWCMPCVQAIPHSNELNKKYKDKDVIFIAVTDPEGGQTLSTVQSFVSKQGDNMDYRVAFDSTRKTSEEYVLGTGAMGIPHSVIIDKQGKIAWLGHPMLPDMEQTVEELVAGTFDLAKAKEKAEKQAKIEPLLQSFNMAVNMGDWERSAKLLDQVLDIDPTNAELIRLAILIRQEEFGGIPAVRTWLEKFIATHDKDADALALLAAQACDSAPMVSRQLDLAIKAVEAAVRTDPQSFNALQAFAQVRYVVCDLDAAVKYQKMAVSVATEPQKEDAKAILAYYERCKSLKNPPAGGS